MRLAALLIAVAPTTAQAQPAEPKPNAELAGKLAAVRDKYKLPAIWSAVVEGDRLLAVAAAGVRKEGSPEPVTVNDLVHIGSDTKAMTATLLAILVEQKKLRWDSTIGEVFPDLKDRFHADYLPVTLDQLLAHRSGLSANADWGPTPEGMTLKEHRRSMLAEILKDAPANKPGMKFGYSNSGYVVAAAMAEAAAGESWEDLMKSRLFKPLGMASAGFGPPGTKGKVDQPWGHEMKKDKLTPLQIDNPPVMAPAGGVHCSMAEWAKFATLHLVGARGKGKLLRAETFRHLHTPGKGFDYSGGWIVHDKDGVLAHDGSNTLWYARIQIHPKDNVAFLVATNRGDDEATDAMGDAVKVLNQFYNDRLRKK
jgi:CubicO group peptidase (beta-lactamase class C family)